MKPRWRILLAVSLACVPLAAHAQDVEPRALTPAPVGTNILGLTLAHSQGAVLLDKTIQARNLDGSTYSLIPSYTRFINLFGLSGRVTAALPFATGAWDAVVGQDTVETDVSRTGLGDGVVSMLVFLAGAPAMTATEFRDYRRKTIVAFNVRVSVPIGQYDPDKLINLGSNRWHVTPALGVSHRMGKWTAEAYAAIWFSATIRLHSEATCVRRIRCSRSSCTWHTFQVQVVVGRRRATNDRRQDQRQRSDARRSHRKHPPRADSRSSHRRPAHVEADRHLGGQGHDRQRLRHVGPAVVLCVVRWGGGVISNQ